MEHRTVEGFVLLPNFLSEAQEDTIINYIDVGKWDNDWTTIIYGGQTNEPVPQWGDDLIKMMKDIAHIKAPFNHMRIHHYKPGTKIDRHVDVASWGPVIVSISLNNKCVLRFTREGISSVDVVIPPRSLYVLAGPARDDWAHETLIIPEDDSARFSITFRTAADQVTYATHHKRDERGLNAAMDKAFAEQFANEKEDGMTQYHEGSAFFSADSIV